MDPGHLRGAANPGMAVPAARALSAGALKAGDRKGPPAG